MHAFVAGNVNEVKDLAVGLLEATRLVEDQTPKLDAEIKYKDGEIIISYKLVKNAVE